MSSSGLGLDEDENIQLIDEIVMLCNNIGKYGYYTLQNTGMLHGEIHHTPNHVISNSDIGNINAIMYPVYNQFPKNNAHEQHSHTFSNTFNDQLVTNDKTHEDVAVPAMAANDVDVSSNKASQNHKSHEVASAKQLVPSQPQTSVELNPNVSEEDSMSVSALKTKLTSVNKHDNTDTESIKKCECNLNCNNMCNNKITYAKSSKRKLMCPTKECNKSFDYKSQLESHIRSHTGEKPFVCTKCGKRFSRSNDLKTHIRSHTGEKPYVCTKCGKGFSRSYNLETHMRSHTGEKPYVCTKCGKRFNHSSNLQTHMRSHTGEKPYVCTKCGQKFSYSSNLNRHNSTQHGDG